MITLVLGLQCLVIYTPVIQNFFSLMPLGLPDIGIVVLSGLIVFIGIEEMKKLMQIRYANSKKSSNNFTSKITIFVC